MIETKKFMHVMALAGAVFLAGCAGVQPHLAKETPPVRGMGYIGGDFTLRNENFHSGFQLKELSTGNEFILSFAGKEGTPAGEHAVGMIAVKPGRYLVTHWVTYNKFWGTRGGVDMKRPVTDGRLAEVLEVKADQVLFLGRFVGNTDWRPGVFSSTTTSAITPLPTSRLMVRQLLNDEYPQFSSLDMVCVMCRP